MEWTICDRWSSRHDLEIRFLRVDSIGEAQAHQTENPDKELKTRLYFNPVEWAKEGEIENLEGACRFI